MIELIQFPWSPFCMSNAASSNSQVLPSKIINVSKRTVLWSGG